MKQSLVKAAAAAILCVVSASSMAFQPAPFDHDHDRHDDHHHAPQHHYNGMHDRGRHEGWYKRGGHVPSEYRRGGYVVTDWRARRLREPPRGYEYVRSDNGDFLMVAVATGVIASIIASH